jgi:hypothetical protein
MCHPWSQVLGYLGDYNHSEESLRKARRTLDALDVVGITERMDETMVLYAERWAIPLAAIRQAYVSLLVNPTKRPVNRSVRAAIEAHPAVAAETRLYEYALRRFETDLSAVVDREAKVASVRAASYACSLSGNCSSGSVGTRAAEQGTENED